MLTKQELDATKEKYSDRLSKWTIQSGEVLNDVDSLLDEIDRLQAELDKANKPTS